MTNDTAPFPATTAGVDRRSVVRTAAWALPVIAVSAQAPAYAASCNQLYTARLDPSQPAQYQATSNLAAQAVVPLTGGMGSVTIDFATTTTTAYTPQPGNYGVNAQVGGTGLPGIHFAYNNSNTNGANTQWYRTRITFSRNVYNLSFLVTDLDNTAGHDERLKVFTTAFTFRIPAGSNVKGTGTAGDPFYNSVPGDPNPVSGKGGNVRINVAGPATDVFLEFTNAATATSNNNNWLTDMTFSAYADGCP